MADGGGGSGGGSDAWKAFFDTLTDEQKSVVNERFKSLETALATERETVKNHSKSLAEMKTKVEKGSELETQLQAAQADLAAANQRSKFVEEAVKRGITNPKAAFAVAKDGGFVDGSGDVNFDKLKEEVPGLFAPANGSGGAREKKSTGGGSGTGTGDQGGKRDAATVSNEMNAAIRQAAGRGPDEGN